MASSAESDRSVWVLSLLLVARDEEVAPCGQYHRIGPVGLGFVAPPRCQRRGGGSLRPVAPNRTGRFGFYRSSSSPEMRRWLLTASTAESDRSVWV